MERLKAETARCLAIRHSDTYGNPHRGVAEGECRTEGSSRRRKRRARLSFALDSNACASQNMAKLIASGASSDVLDLGDGRVLKAFRRISYTDLPVEDWQDHEALTRAVFHNEAVGYEKLQQHADLCVYAPEYFGCLDPIVIGMTAGFPPERYVAGCGIVLEQISGVATKIAHLPVALRVSAEHVLEEIRDRITPGNVWDCSCFVPGSRAQITLIDFALWEKLGHFSAGLGVKGRLNESHRRCIAQFIGRCLTRGSI
jgi:hypothetical protein